MQPPVIPKTPRPGLGDRIEQALTLVGITTERVERLMGRPCGCRERKERLNRLGQWAARILTGQTDGAKESLDAVLKDCGPEDSAKLP